VAVGVSDYKEDNLDLHYAAADAHALHRALVAQEGKAYQKVHSILLADGAFEPPQRRIFKMPSTYFSMLAKMTL
jgi:uncharacterized caspase-like protein